MINEDNGDYWQYEYTIKNRLKAVYRNGIKLAEFTYDGDGNQIISDTIDEGRITYVFNNANKYSTRGMIQEAGAISMPSNRLPE